MGKISKVIYKQVTECSQEEVSEAYWFQNVLDIDHSTIKDYEEYEDKMKRMRNKNIVDILDEIPARLTPLVDTTMMGASIRGGVTLITELQ